ncbi:GNAT family N-acetyltransferase [Paenibacillus senegalensis]|uniref:GNAT family N-acetyltransferase n=1 Tax=Paenibacillus senegalensis TaxID=1465766 RepID=UPI000287F6C5|nr:GNAT family protein [Paenibacillus senegalensis]
MIIKGHRVWLKSVDAGDHELLHSLICAEEDPEWKRWDAPYNRLENVSLEKFSRQLHSRLAEEKIPPVLLIQINHETVGTVVYYWQHAESYWLEVGAAIYRPEYWGQGYGTEALSLWIEYLFAHLPIVRVGLTTWSGNERMMRCAEKLGMKLEGRIRQCLLVEGQLYDSIKMGMLREEWEERRPAQE